MADLIQGIDTPTTGGTDHTPYLALDIGDISAGHSSTPILTAIEAAVLEDIPHALLPANTAACTALQPMVAPVTPNAETATGIVTPHPTLTISAMGATHTTLQTRPCLTSATPSTQHRDPIPGKPNNTQDPQPPIIPTA